jgi:plastocyanin
MNREKSVASILAILLGAILSTACGSSTPTAPGTPTPAPTATPVASANQVTISGFAFSALSVPMGTTVTWKNLDSVAHTATADPGSAFQFDTGTIDAGATSKGIVFSQMGTFAYHCNFHSSMHGTITVQ